MPVLISDYGYFTYIRFRSNLLPVCCRTESYTAKGKPRLSSVKIFHSLVHSFPGGLSYHGIDDLSTQPGRTRFYLKFSPVHPYEIYIGGSLTFRTPSGTSHPQGSVGDLHFRVPPVQNQTFNRQLRPPDKTSSLYLNGTSLTDHFPSTFEYKRKGKKTLSE